MHAAEAVAPRIRLVCAKGAQAHLVFLASCGQQPGQSGEIVGDDCQNEAGSHPFDTARYGLGHSTDGLCRAEGLFDPLAVLD